MMGSTAGADAVYVLNEGMHVCVGVAVGKGLCCQGEGGGVLPTSLGSY